MMITIAGNSQQITTVEYLLNTYGDAYITRTYFLDVQWFYCQTADGKIWKANASNVQGNAHYKSGHTIIENYQRLVAENYTSQMRQAGIRTLPYGYGYYGGGINVNTKNVGVNVGGGYVGVRTKNFSVGFSTKTKVRTTRSGNVVTKTTTKRQNTRNNSTSTYNPRTGRFEHR